MLEAPRGLSHPQTSFIGTVCQGIHHTPFRAAHAPKNPNDSFKRQTTNHHTVKNDHKTIDLETRLQKKKPGEIAIKQTMTSHHRIARVHYPVLKPPRAPTGPDPRPTGRRRPARGIRKTARDQVAGGGPGTQKHIRTTPRKAPKDPRSQRSLPHQHAHTNPGTIPGAWATRRTTNHRPEKLRRKEVIQPHLPVRLPCYDLVPITSLTLDGSIHKGLGHRLRVLPTFMT